jgi:hypothetical protein
VDEEKQLNQLLVSASFHISAELKMSVENSNCQKNINRGGVRI